MVGNGWAGARSLHLPVKCSKNKPTNHASSWSLLLDAFSDLVLALWLYKSREKISQGAAGSIAKWKFPCVPQGEEGT